jgi:transposase-like protein
MESWQNRVLKDEYLVVYFDAIWTKVKPTVQYRKRLSIS